MARFLQTFAVLIAAGCSGPPHARTPDEQAMAPRVEPAESESARCNAAWLQAFQPAAGRIVERQASSVRIMHRRVAHSERVHCGKFAPSRC